MSFYCNHCGNGLPSSARFCSSCGAVIAAPASMPGRPLVRPFMDRKIAGVCAGLAQAYGWDVAIVRVIAFIGLFFSGGLVFIAYLACWIGIPEEPIGVPGAYPPQV